MCGNPHEIALPLHQVQDFSQMQQTQLTIKSPPASSSNLIINNHINLNTTDHDNMHTKEDNTVIANVTNHTARIVVSSTELEPLDPKNTSTLAENSSSNVANMTNGFCDNPENIYGNVVGPPSGTDLQNGIETISANEIKTQQQHHENSSDTIVPLVSSKGMNNIASALQHTRNQLMIKHQQSLHQKSGNRGLAEGLATQLGILVLKEKQKYHEEQEVQKRQVYELQHIHQCSQGTLPPANITTSSNTSPNKNIRDNHFIQHDKPTEQQIINAISSRNGSEKASVNSNLSKDASMSGLDDPDIENIIRICEPATCSEVKETSGGNVDNVNVCVDPVVCYKGGRRRRQKKSRDHYPEIVSDINYAKNTVQDVQLNTTETVLTQFCSDCAAASSLSRMKARKLDINSAHQPSTTFDKSPRQIGNSERIHNIPSRSCNRITEPISPPYNLATTYGTDRKNKGAAATIRDEEHYDHKAHEQQHHHTLATTLSQQQPEQQHYNNPRHHGHINTSITPHHHSYHHHHRHRSQGQLLIDDADILHQCLVSLAGERNVAMLLKRFQERQQSSALTKEPTSPC